MGGGSHDYACSKLSIIAADFGDLGDSDIEELSVYINAEERRWHITEQLLRKHPLRVALARFLDKELYEILRSIERCDSGDRARDKWISALLPFFEKHNIEYDENWESTYMALLTRYGLDDTGDG